MSIILAIVFIVPGLTLSKICNKMTQGNNSVIIVSTQMNPEESMGLPFFKSI